MTCVSGTWHLNLGCLNFDKARIRLPTFMDRRTQSPATTKHSFLAVSEDGPLGPVQKKDVDIRIARYTRNIPELELLS